METEIPEPCRIDFNQDVEDEGCERLPVYLRIKPQEEDEMSIKILNSTTIETDHAYRANKKAVYTHIFPGSATQEQVFDVTSARLIRKFLCGANVMTFAYGVTSSGKTYTILGTHTDPGILPRTLETVFTALGSKIERTRPFYKPTRFDGAEKLTGDEYDELEHLKSTLTSKMKASNDPFDRYSFANTDTCLLPAESPITAAKSCAVWISIYEIHNEVISDLFCPEANGKRKALTIGQDSNSRTFVKDLLHLPVGSASEAYSLLQFARQNLATASTKLNDRSSRSHMVFNLKIVSSDGTSSVPFVNQLVVSDLAGNERQAKTGTSGLALRQAGAINNSLLVLGRCLEALRKEDKRIAAPFRESKLTRMLNPFFTLGGYVSLIICISPSIHLQDETMDTIRLSAIASEIVQDPVRPIERLRQLRRLTLGCIENSPVKIVPDADVEHWQEAVNGTTVHDGVTYLAVRASYFNDMARDILRAEKLLSANEAEIRSLKERLTGSEASKENIKLMYQDKLKGQREKFAEQRAELNEMHRVTQKTLEADFEEEIAIYKEKYLKYRNGYAKMSEYLKDKLWPEVCLFRERFGCLPEFPPKDEAQTEEARPENTIKYWQDKLHDKEVEYRALRTELHNKSDETSRLEKYIEEQEKLLRAAEAELQDSRRESAELASRVNELSEQVASLTNQLGDHETLADEINDLKRRLLDAEEERESLIAEHQIRLNSVLEEFDNLKSELREKNFELEEASRALTSAQVKIATPDEGTPLKSEKSELEGKVLGLKSELSKQRKHCLELQESIISLRDEVEKLTGKETELAKRERQTSLKLRETRRSQSTENETAQLMDDMKGLRTALEDGRVALAEKNALVMLKEAGLGELRDRVTTLETLEHRLLSGVKTMGLLREKTRESRDRIKVLQNENKRLEVEVKHVRELEAKVELLTKNLANQRKRIQRNHPRTKEMDRRRRSISSSELELKRPVAEKPEDRLRVADEGNSIPASTWNRPVFFYC